MPMNSQSYELGVATSSIREIAAYAAARKAQIGPQNVFDFSLGNPSVPAPPEVRASIERSLALDATALHGYTPAAGLPEVRKAVAASLNRRFMTSYDAGDVYLTCGAAASIAIVLNALVSPGDEVIVIAPYFPEYRVWIEAAGARCVEVRADERTFQLDVDAVARAVTEHTRAVLINSPNNPVGTIYPREDLERLGRVLDECGRELGGQVHLIADEPYREISYGAEVPWVPDAYGRTVVCYSYSKSLSLAGERIGWVLVPKTNPEHDELVPAVAGSGRKLGFVCAPALFQRVVADCVDVPSDVAAYAKNRAALTEGLSQAGYTYVEPQGAFYLWVKALEPDAKAFFRQARELELLPVPSDSFGCPGWVRVGYCVSHDTIVNSIPAWERLAQRYGRRHG
ncbi:pyridoxal phosphate-dependent aminotransferase [Olsenella massiliensis]|uniref:pyridoxal phosphate-dependent aminotransferase n=1 Tax=Olsenella massiliensis TaxID=1622075 RepID=UPI0009E69D15|nr:pyridoxal phosphate-dependent aminotransferase [Olsenella massiliensis]